MTLTCSTAFIFAACPIVSGKVLWYILNRLGIVVCCVIFIPTDYILEAVLCADAADDMVNDVHIAIMCSFKRGWRMLFSWMRIIICHRGRGIARSAVGFSVTNRLSNDENVFRPWSRFRSVVSYNAGETVFINCEGAQPDGGNIEFMNEFRQYFRSGLVCNWLRFSS